MRKLAVLFLILALVVIAAAVDHVRSVRASRASQASLVAVGQLTKADILFHGTHVLLERDLARGNAHWHVRRYADLAVRDDRANEDLLSHVLDLVKALSDETTSRLDPKDAKEYGMDAPELALTLGWDKPAPGEDTVVFGHRDLSGHRSFAYFPKRPLLVEVPSSAVAVLEGRLALDLRDRRITTFDTDDVEDLSASGKCGRISLTRDGDRWMSGDKVLADKPTEAWLSNLVETHYDGADDVSAGPGKPAGANMVCTIHLTGIRGRTETVEVFKANGTLWSRSSALPARYLLPKGFLTSLIPPKG